MKSCANKKTRTPYLCLTCFCLLAPLHAAEVRTSTWTEKWPDKDGQLPPHITRLRWFGEPADWRKGRSGMESGQGFSFLLFDFEKAVKP